MTDAPDNDAIRALERMRQDCEYLHGMVTDIDRKPLDKQLADDLKTIRTELQKSAQVDEAIEDFCRTWLHCGMEEAKTLHSKLWAKNQAPNAE